MSDFHFLRPDWLWALIPAAIIVALVWRGRSSAGGHGWVGTVDAHLLKHLTVGGAAARLSRGLPAMLAAGLLATVLAMAGPAWERLPTPTTRGAEPVVVVLSLAQSMNGTDLVPSRLARAGHKLRDILDRAAGEDLGLVIYADRPFVAAPLTPDAGVIREMLPELSTSLMPVLGNRLDRAVSEAHELLASAGASRGRILVMADDLGADPEASLAAARFALADGYTVSVLGVGTSGGATLQTADGQAIRVGGDAPVVRLDSAAMRGLAAAGGGRYSEVTAASADLDRLLPASTASAQPGRRTDLKADRWQDRGYLLLLVPVLLMPFAFRRGLLFALAIGFVGLGGAPGSARAAGMDDLWATPDQQGARAFADGDYEAAAAEFSAPDWRAGALYRAGNYEAAAAAYGDDGYNAGNALALAGRFEEALAAYDRRLAEAPEDTDAQFNRDVVAKLLEQQEAAQQQQEQQQSGQTGEDQQQSDQAGEEQKQSGQSGEDQQQSGQAGDDQQQSDQAGEAQQQAGEPGADQQEAQDAEPGGQQDGDGQQQAGQPSEGQQLPKSGAEQQAGETEGGREKAGQKGENRQQPGEPGEATGETRDAAEAGAPELPAQSAKPRPTGEDTDTLSALIDRLLQGNGADEEEGDETAATASTAGEPLSQAEEQQLRAVPDDPAGLLRARIRQHYAQLRANGQ
jgi:Ca-activated chloride channel family protein